MSPEFQCIAMLLVISVVIGLVLAMLDKSNEREHARMNGYITQLLDRVGVLEQKHQSIKDAFKDKDK